jgi:hypothetical protein
VKYLLKALLIASGSEISVPFTTILGILIEPFALDRMLLIPFQVSLVRPTLFEKYEL